MNVLMPTWVQTHPRPRPDLAAVPWSPKLKWEKHLKIQASTYKPLSLFKVEPGSSDIYDLTKAQRIVSPSGAWCYCEKLLRRGVVLATYYGSCQGAVEFDDDVIVPALHERHRWHKDRWSRDPWMSLTPMEMFTLRGGIRRAKGDVVVAGLGLGYQLIEVSRRRTVKRLRLIERSQELVDWLLPRIKPHLGCELADVIVGDVYDELPKLTADVALVDVFDTYGNNDWERDRLRHDCKHVDYVWVWGSAVIN